MVSAKTSQCIDSNQCCPIVRHSLTTGEVDETTPNFFCPFPLSEMAVANPAPPLPQKMELPPKQKHDLLTKVEK